MIASKYLGLCSIWYFSPLIPGLQIASSLFSRAILDFLGSPHHQEEEKVDLTTMWSRVMESIKPRRGILAANTGQMFENHVSKHFLSTFWCCCLFWGLVIKEEDAHTHVEQFIHRMEEAAKADLEEYRVGKPMVKKLELLPEAVEVMEKYQFADAFIAYGGCRVLALWLQPLPTGTLPSVHLRSALLRCMERLPISKEALSRAGEPLLGRIVAQLQTNPEETLTNRKRAQGLVQRWLRQIMAPEEEDDSLLRAEQVGTIPRPPPVTEESLAKIAQESAKRLHPTIPVIEAKDYVIQPVSTAQPIIREKLSMDTYKGKLNEVLKFMARPNKKSYKPFSVSVAGRELNAEWPSDHDNALSKKPRDERVNT